MIEDANVGTLTYVDVKVAHDHSPHHGGIKVFAHESSQALRSPCTARRVNSRQDRGCYTVSSTCMGDDEFVIAIAIQIAGGHRCYASRCSIKGIERKSGRPDDESSVLHG